jgi:hypothetical protein
MLTRYFTYNVFEACWKDCLNNLTNVACNAQVLGTSVLGEAIYGVQLGNGKHRVLVWSNMHGNETTTTRALMLFLNRCNLTGLLAQLTLYIIPVLNPDGLNNWTRVNANNADLNRDAQDLNQPESVILRQVFVDFKPHFCFNMHDQRSIYGNESGDKPMQLSFLAPAATKERTITPARLQAMQVVNAIYKKVSKETAGIIGRYNDAFNDNCVGDYFQSRDVPTILFEAGHAGEDYYREKAVILIEECFTEALQAVSSKAVLHEELVVETYLNIPPIAQNYVDVLLKNVPDGFTKAHLAIVYHETVVDSILYFVPMLVGINVTDIKNAHRVIDCDAVSVFAHDLSVDANLVVSCPSLEVLTFH